MSTDNRQGVPLLLLLVALVVAIISLGSRPAYLDAQRNERGSNGSQTRSTPAQTPTTSFRPRNPRIELVRIPSGTFMMGSTNGDPDERPVHQVKINYSFYIGKYEVTQSQWQAVMGTTVRQQRDKADPSWPIRGEGDSYPMYYVSWGDTQDFVRRLNALNDGYLYRLPTEAEWEYACRAGTNGDRAGDLDSMAWYGNTSGNGYIDAHSIWRNDQSNYFKRLADNGNRTHTVGAKRANATGLYDMLGNVWEWCEDWHHPNYDGAPTDGSAWLSGAGEHKYRVLRGGSWNNSASLTRYAYREDSSPTDRNDAFGFRVVAVARTKERA